MTSRIMKKISEQETGWVCTQKDFLDAGDLESVSRALSHLVEDDRLRRVARGLYDVPRTSKLLKRVAPVNLYSAVAAVARRDQARLMSDGSTHANMLGLTNLVPAKIVYDTDGVSRTLEIGRRTVRFCHAPPKVMRWAGRPGEPVVQALRWLGPYASSDPDVIPILKRILPDYVKLDLLQGVRYMPGWMQSIVDNVTGKEVT